MDSKKIKKIIKSSLSLEQKKESLLQEFKELDLYEFEKLFNYLYENINNSLFFNYIKRTGIKYFSFERYLLYKEYRKINKSDSQSEYFYKLIYGEDYETFLKKRSRKNIYDPNYIKEKFNFSSLDDAIDYIKNYKKNKSTSKENFVRKYGEVEGLEKFKKFQETSKHTKEKYINIYGEKDGLKKWKEYLKLKKEKSVFNINYWIQKGFNKDEAEKLRKEFHNNKLNVMSINYYLNKGLTEKDALNEVKKQISLRKVALCKASKESMKYFQKIIDLNKELKYYCGVENSEELMLYDEKTKKIFFYDFCFPELKLIIEYHGERFHPNPKILTKEKWEVWNLKNYNGINYNADEKYAFDLYKENVARKHGYDYLIIWSNVDSKTNWKIINNTIKNKKKEYENKKYN